MAKQKSGDKLGDIRQATIAEVVESGSSAASVNVIAKRAGLAVGTVYRYYDNKDHLLRDTYLAVKIDLHSAMMSSLTPDGGAHANIRAMWFAILEFARMHPQAFLFAEMVLNDLILATEDRTQIEDMAQETRAVIRNAIEEGVVRDLGLDAVVTVLAAPAMQIGRNIAMCRAVTDDRYCADVFKLCWRAIEA